ncbi:MAG: 3-isopropylmalate/(R)-2-methylmalate dehydratase large subunit [Acidimicrobiaceae bacterium]|jgi:3-isopropylmalate/(R)-2-methylmalate dehydratase large subunit|nr:3-isopropylmalate/(R)-2-methylmalate dehydratase large subunit [Acidimicrobiaceae bacterium]
MTDSTLFGKIWDSHVVEHLGEGWVLLHIDRHLLHDLSGPSALLDVKRRGLAVGQPTQVFAMADHLVSTAADRTPDSSAVSGRMWAALKSESDAAGIEVAGVDDAGQGIVHVSGPEQAMVLPGLTVICGDSHTCTNGALGALAFGVGSSQSAQALATRVLLQQRPLQMRINVDGVFCPRVSAKDLALYLIADLGASAGVGYAVEYAGNAVEAMGVEERLTLCNLTVELGARFGMIAPDATTLEWIEGRRLAPRGPAWDQATEAWRQLRSDIGAVFDQEHRFDATALDPMVTWGTSPEHGVSITGVVPDPADAANPTQAQAWRHAQEYMDLRPRQRLSGIPVDWVFIGSCANSRLPDLRAAAGVVRGRHVADGVTAWVVPGSEQVRHDAEAEGLDRSFEQAGFVWRRPGCSLCVAANGDRVPPGARCVSTSNRNFVGRQGPGARTHLASPATAAAAAVTGCLVDPRGQ